MRRIWPALLIGLTFPAAGVAPGRAAALAADAPAAPVGAPDSLGVEACVALAREQAPALRAARLDRSAAVSDSVAAAANARPGFSLNAGALVAPRGFYDPTLTNLGEPILRRVARAHGGEVEVSASPLGGARFELRLPGWVPRI